VRGKKGTNGFQQRTGAGISLSFNRIRGDKGKKKKERDSPSERGAEITANWSVASPETRCVFGLTERAKSGTEQGRVHKRPPRGKRGHCESHLVKFTSPYRLICHAMWEGKEGRNQHRTKKRRGGGGPNRIGPVSKGRPSRSRIAKNDQPQSRDGEGKKKEDPDRRTRPLTPEDVRSPISLLEGKNFFWPKTRKLAGGGGRVADPFTSLTDRLRPRPGEPALRNSKISKRERGEKWLTGSSTRSSYVPRKKKNGDPFMTMQRKESTLIDKHHKKKRKDVVSDMRPRGRREKNVDFLALKRSWTIEEAA